MSLNRVAVKRVLKANLVKYMQGIFSGISDIKVIKELEEFLFENHYEFTHCFEDVNFESISSMGGSEFTGYGETVQTWEDPPETEEFHFDAPGGFKLGLSGIVDADCIYKSLSKNFPRYSVELKDAVYSNSFAKLFGDMLSTKFKDWGSHFPEYIGFEDELQEELDEEWMTEASASIRYVDLELRDVKVKKSKAKYSGSNIIFQVLLEADVEATNIEFEEYLKGSY